MLDARLIHAVHAAGGDGAVFQTSTLEALLHGAYLGDVTVAALAARGDLGLGTFDALDGELILVDGIVYRAAADGSVAPAEPGRRSPFAVVTRFTPRAELRLGPLDFDALLERLDRAVPRDGVCTAVRIDGTFERLRLRSVPAQEPPFRSLDAVLSEQRVLDAADVTGTIVGFRFLPGAAGPRRRRLPPPLHLGGPRVRRPPAQLPAARRGGAARPRRRPRPRAPAASGCPPRRRPRRLARLERDRPSR